MMKKILLLVIFLVVLMMSQSSFGATSVFLHLEGENQGLIEGDSDYVGNENLIVVHVYEHSVMAVRDNLTCQPSGQLNHQPLKIAKHLDNASPKLLKALVDNESLHGYLKFYRLSTTVPGTEEYYYTIEFENAHITGIRQNIPSDTSDPYVDKEYISFSYSEITETYEPDSIEESAIWHSDCGQTIRISDLNFDGVVNMLDLAIMADEWLMPH